MTLLARRAEYEHSNIRSLKPEKASTPRWMLFSRTARAFKISNEPRVEKFDLLI